MQMTNWKHWAVGSVAALTMMIGSFYTADTASAASPVADDLDSANRPMIAMANAEADQFGRGPRNDAAGGRYNHNGGGLGLRAGVSGDALLADALDITEDELLAARESAAAKAADDALAQAVANGDMTQEQANALKTLQGLGNGRFGQRMPMSGNYDAYLAEALGITEDQLLEARHTAHVAGIAQAVADSTITQEEADEMLAMMDLRDYVQPQMESAFESAIQSAVAEGVITQEQADELLSNSNGRGLMGGPRSFAPGMKGGMRDSFSGDGFRGDGPGMRGRSMHQGYGLNQ